MQLPSCLSDDAVLAFVESRISDSERGEAEKHLDACSPCRMLVSELARRVSSGSNTPDSLLAGENSVASAPLNEGAQVGRFLVLRPIGKGGMGTVYSAYDPQLDRKIAVKVIRPRGSVVSDWISEAKAMARLTHPCVVTVHDVGIFDSSIFIAMELVEGANLRAWLRERTRSPNEILTVLLDCGEGLYGAHQAKLVHSDFKPDNVLVGKNGRAKVTDFGLARLLTESTVEPSSGPVRIAGTPAYMSPEQKSALQLDARSDQYSFALTVRETLENSPALLRILAPVLATALQTDRSKRYPSMRELLDDLDSAPKRRKRLFWFAAAFASVSLAGSLALHQVHLERQTQCEPPRPPSELWNTQIKMKIREAMLATGAAFARDAWQGAEASLDKFLHRWSDERREACELTKVRKIESEQAFALRAACFERRLDEVRAIVDLLGNADAAIVEHAVSAASRLTPLEVCRGTATLAMQPIPPRGRDTARKVERIRVRLDGVKALYDAGKFTAAFVQAQECLKETESIDYLPIQAEAKHWIGALHDTLANEPLASDTLFAALSDAQAGHADETAARSGILLVWIVGYKQGRYEAGEVLARSATALVRRSGARPDLEAMLESHQGTLYWAKGDLGRAERHYQKARDLWTGVAGPTSIRVADALNNLGLIRWSEGFPAEARSYHQAALQMRISLLGSNHPAVGSSLSNLGLAELDLDEPAKAIETHRGALSVYKTIYGLKHNLVAGALNNLGFALVESGAAEAGLPHLIEAYEIRKGLLPATHPDVANSLVNLSLAHTRMHHPTEALRLIEATLREQSDVLGNAHPSLAEFELVHARALREAARYGDALTAIKAAIAIASGTLREGHPLRWSLEAEKGMILVHLRKGREAIAVLEPLLNSSSARGEFFVGEVMVYLIRARMIAREGTENFEHDAAMASKKLSGKGLRGAALLNSLAMPRDPSLKLKLKI
ncbi:MAG: serine/threonine protein kinase [Polyangiaceae bacterium]|nr:serine/threonine protein kinase [Polyangiaceae bacterium]